MKKRTFWQKAGGFLSGKGFYMVLLLCVAAIGASGWYLWKTVRLATGSVTEAVSATVTASAADEEEAPPEQEELTMEDSEADGSGNQTADDADGVESTVTAAPVSDSSAAEDAEDAEDAGEEASSNNQVVETTVETVDNLHQTMQYPVQGAVVATFSSDTLTYNEALEDWRTHNGVDLSAEVGDEVVAAWSGQVVSVREDAVLGTVVTVDCGDGYATVYGNLDEAVAVSAGDQLSAGDVIGTVGETAGGETHDGAGFLHFAVTLDGEYLDPMDFLS